MLRASLIVYGSGFMRTIGKRKKAAAATAATTAINGKTSSVSTVADKKRRKKATTQVEEMMDGDSTPVIHNSNSTHTRLGDGNSEKASNSRHGTTATGLRSRRNKRSDEEVLQLAQRMQRRDLTGEVPVASFAYEILKAHPSVRQMGLRERMSFLCDRWDRLRKEQRQVYLDDPLKGLL
ncbi:hypothetical protein C3747_21g150 [Trypanosoma cruzi]|uniref:Uncharacterized protein n=2 Tax=Trypanosoma cruzi TaxID=5693 RepID=Q4D1L6_TRYCC|nr:hypothetical protein, conserved [Trypanosoma cruzi]EAN86416.1 hypothetical protein, conserved [Trypanosoma cruzi]PWV16874.1 hypothetical protein C3747_21g150 [Trypanosoma cruzi]RNC45115.1 hypothetical protein TcCL_NonESM05153 [Trypanosoma cruzi]|eukprot:XP_808267.1 hypothetical protein [Trypanosoma cruzi strain CL Brener]